MKKTRYLSLFTAVLLLCGILSACNSAPQSAGLCLPGLEWGQSVDEALTALGASQEELGEDFYSETGRQQLCHSPGPRGLWPKKCGNHAAVRLCICLS